MMEDKQRDELLIRIDEKVNGINARLDILNGKTAGISKQANNNTNDIRVLQSQPSAWKAIGLFSTFISILYVLDKFIF